MLDSESYNNILHNIPLELWAFLANYATHNLSWNSGRNLSPSFSSQQWKTGDKS